MLGHMFDLLFIMLLVCDHLVLSQLCPIPCNWSADCLLWVLQTLFWDHNPLEEEVHACVCGAMKSCVRQRVCACACACVCADVRAVSVDVCMCSHTHTHMCEAPQVLQFG